LKELHASISKLGKTVDKNFLNDITKAYDPTVKFDIELENQIIAEHLFRQGKFEIGDAFVKEANVKINSKIKEQFAEMYKILDKLEKSKDLHPAIEWAKIRRKDLERIDSPLEFKLHRLEFISFLLENKPDLAIKYARLNFEPFSKKHLENIQHLMGALLFAGKLEMSPYASMLSDSQWTDIGHEFASVCCSIMGLPYESPLYTAVAAGQIALPKTLKLASIMQQTKMHTKFLPVEIELGTDFQFHTVVACPVSREQTTPDNPPMLLSCGHVISKASMLKLAKGNQRLKCPYCPSEVLLTKSIQVSF